MTLLVLVSGFEDVLEYNETCGVMSGRGFSVGACIAGCRGWRLVWGCGKKTAIMRGGTVSRALDFPKIDF